MIWFKRKLEDLITQGHEGGIRWLCVIEGRGHDGERSHDPAKTGHHHHPRQVVVRAI